MEKIYKAAKITCMLTLYWPSTSATHAEAWRLLDLSGLVPTERDARMALNTGLVYINNAMVTSTKYKVAIKDTYRLELRFPKKTRSVEFLLVNALPRSKPRRGDLDLEGEFRRG